MPMTDPKTQIDRINEISAIARTSWLALLGYLAFIGISLLAVEDADFFVPTRRTDLPLVGVAIPTYSFFFFAPILAAALYVYLQVHLLKLWDAIADAPADRRRPPARRAPPPLDRQRLRARPQGQRRPPPAAAALARQPRHPPAGLDRRPGGDRRLLVALDARPRRMADPRHRRRPALRAPRRHDQLVDRPRPPPHPWLHAGPWDRWWRRPAGIAVALAVVAVSWLRTEGGFDHYANRLIDLADAAFGTALFKDCAPTTRTATPVPAQSTTTASSPTATARSWPTSSATHRRAPWLPNARHVHPDPRHWLAGIWLDEGETWNPLARTDLEGVEMVDLPEAWRTPETARAAFRKTWCEREGLSMAVCDHPPSPDRPSRRLGGRPRGMVRRAQAPTPRPASSQLADLDARFEAAWTEERAPPSPTSPGLTLAGRDLRNASACRRRSSTRTSAGRGWRGRTSAGAAGGGEPRRGAAGGGGPRGARLEGADLGGARLEGANLDEARLDGADLAGARLEGADLAERGWRGRTSAGRGWRGRTSPGASGGATRLEGANL